MGIRLKTILDSPCGMRYMFSKLEIQSPFSTHLLMDNEMAIDCCKIQHQYEELSEFYNFFGKEARFFNITNKLKLSLCHLRDIRGTIKRLSDGDTLDDIELFEIKNLALISETIKNLLIDIPFSYIKLPNQASIVEILDPEGQKINSFYIYDSYSDELRELRRMIRSSTDYNEEHLYRAATIEEKIRKSLALKLKPFASILNETLHLIAKIDILLAKTQQITDLDLTIPVISDTKNAYCALFNPEVKELLEINHQEFQDINIEFETNLPLLITGANMGGKSITLKTLALSQYLFQFGFGIPAKSAYIVPVQDILFSIGDDQNLHKGLSSFAAEMIRIDAIIQSAKKGKFILSLIDEPASTTNPYEGTALVSSLIKTLSKYKILNVITTHYNINNAHCKRLRVIGLENNKMNYSLIEDTETKAPHEALKIAATLGVDLEWIQMAEDELN